MYLFKINKEEGELLTSTITQLEEDRAEINRRTKSADDCKKTIEKILLETRKLELSVLKEKEVVIVELPNCGIQIIRKGRDLFDRETFRALNPELAKQFTVRKIHSEFNKI